MPDQVIPAATVDALAEAVHNCYGEAFMQPDVGILLDADPALTYEWRVAQTGRVEPGEDLGLAGRTGRESYVDFQAEMAREYRDAAELWGWDVLSVDGRPQEQTIAEVVKIVLSHPGVQTLLRERASR
jgi:thymidylate kinase